MGGGKLLDTDILCQKAEEALRERQSRLNSVRSEADVLRLVHELEVHQIELEMQNEELLLAKEKAELATAKYFDLYEFAPSGYFVLSREGRIIQVNLAGYKIFGIDRSQLKNHTFGFFVSSDSKPVFNLFLSRVFSSNTKETCNLTLSVPNDRYLHITGFAEPDNNECFVTVVDITEQKRAEKKLILANEELVILYEEKAKRAAELVLANKELSFQDSEKTKRAAELIVANKELLFQNNEKAKRAEELVLANIELLFQNDEKAKRAAELVLSNKELLLSNDENAKLAVELLLANKELLFQNDEKTHRSDELVLANIELLFQNQEKEKRAEELGVANKLISFQRDRLEEIASLVPGVVFQYRLHPDGTSCFPYASEAIRQIYRVNPEEVREDASKVFLNLHPDDYEDVVISIRESAKNLSLWQHEHRVKFEDGTIRSLYGNALPKTETDGSVLWHGFITDITERKDAENEFRESEERFRNLAEHSRVITWECDSKGLYTYISRVCTEVLGYEPETIIGKKHFYDLHPKQGREEFKTAAFEVFSRKELISDLENSMETIDNQIICVSTNGMPILDPQGNLTGYRGSDMDITQRKHSEAEIIYQLALINALLDSIPDMIFFKDTEGVYLGCNPQFSTFVGKSRSEIVGKTDHDLFEKAIADSFRQYDLEMLMQKLPRQNEEWITYPDGRKALLDTLKTPYWAGDGSLLGVLGISRDITERKKTEDELNLNESKLRAITGSANDAILMMDEQGLISFWNRAASLMFGYSNDEAIGQNLHELLVPKHYHLAANNALPVFFHTGQGDVLGKTSEVEAIRKDGQQIAVELSISSLHFNNAWHAVGIIKDITERKKIEKALLDSQARYSSMISNISDVIGIFGADGLVKYKSPNIEKIFGWLPEERVGMSIFSMIHPDDMEYAQKVFNSLLGEDNSVKTLEFRYKCKEGSYKPIELTAANLLNDPVINGILLNYRDISGRKATEEEKLKADITIGILSLAINQSPVTVLITDLAGNIESVNSRFTEVTGYIAEEVIGQNPKILKAGDRPDFDYKELWNTILSGGNWHGIFHNRKKNGELFWESAVISPVKDQYGTITHFLAVKEDITSRLKSEQEIKHKNEELQKLNFERDKFFAIIAHDLRGPLGSMKGMTEMMADESYEFTECETKEMTLELSRSVRNTFNLLENLLEWSQMDRGLTEFKPQKLGLMNMVTDCINVVTEQARGKGIALNVDIATGHEVLADKNMLQTVIRNLLSNAIKFTPKGGSVTISAKPAENDRMVISVKDTGIGMNDEMQNNLFNIGANTKRPGTGGEKSTGLGLLLCKEFVEKNGGEIRIESEQNHGTIFSFTIPSTGQQGNEKAHLNAEFTEKAAGKINNLKTLIAEDDNISAKLIHTIVKGFSREVLQAKTGKDAIQICLSNPDIDLVLMDIAMPLMDGYEATRQIRQFNQKVIIIAQTTFVFPADREKAFEAGCNDYIAKPYDKEALLGVIKKHIIK